MHLLILVESVVDVVLLVNEVMFFAEPIPPLTINAPVDTEVNKGFTYFRHGFCISDFLARFPHRFPQARRWLGMCGGLTTSHTMVASSNTE